MGINDSYALYWFLVICDVTKKNQKAVNIKRDVILTAFSFIGASNLDSIFSYTIYFFLF